MKRHAVAFFLVFFFIVASPVQAPADMYKWTDRNGVVHFSSQPGDPSAELLQQEDLPPVTEGPAPQSNLIPETTSYPGAIAVTARLLFDGRPLSDLTGAPATIRLYNQHLKQWFTPDYSYDAASGTIKLRGIAEGTYTGQVLVDADRSNPDQYPGDYKGNVSFTAAPASAVMATVNMERIIHLIRPEDNGTPLTEWGEVCSNKIEFETPVEIAWEPIGSGVSYSYSIVRTVCQPFGFKEAVAADRTTATRVVLDLPPNRAGEFYTLRLEARKNDRPVGSLMSHGKSGWGWDYRFRVLPKRGPTRVISPVKN